MERVIFYSPNDWAGGYNLKKTEELLETYDENNNYNDINDLLEFYNINKYIENGVYLKDWDTQYIKSIKLKIKSMKSKVFGFFKTEITNDNIIKYYEETINEYKKYFLELYDKCINFINIDNDVFIKLLETGKVRMYDLLHLKNIVQKFDKVIAEFLKRNPIGSAEILINKYVVDDENYNSMIIPKSLSLRDKEEIITKYLDMDEPNLNYVRIIEKIKSSHDSIVLDDKIRLKAQIKKNELEEKYFKENDNKIVFGTGIYFDDNQEEIEKITKKDNETTYAYSGKWIIENLDYETLLNNFIYIFDFVDPFFRIKLVNKKAELGVFERTMKFKTLRSYNPGHTFYSKANLAELQLTAYYEYLARKKIRLEDIIEWFFREYLKREFGVDNYIISMPSENSNYFEKCKSILPEFDLVLKEFKYYCDDREINQKLINISSTQMFFKDIPSLVPNKYVYAYENDDMLRIYYYFFSDQCMLMYDQKNNKSYNCFYSLLSETSIKYDDYHVYEQQMLDWLIEKDLICLDDNNYIRIKDRAIINIYADLYYNEVINYWHYNKELRTIVDSLIENQILYTDNTLFSKPEQDYFNYYLNMSEFIDGYDIRNSNLHGTQEGDRNSEIHKQKYMKIILLLILIVIKINDDFCLYADYFKSQED